MAILESKGEPVQFRDVLIAAISKTNDMQFMTRDSEHLSRIPGLRVVEVA